MKNLRPQITFTCLLAISSLAATTFAVSPPPDGGYPGSNTAEGGSGALFSLTTGTNNTALGAQALFSLTTGVQNTATGAQALKNNTGNNNTADGFQALAFTTIGYDNAATGWRALFQNTDGYQNTATGSQALYNNIDGSGNTADGFEALYLNSGYSNVGIGLKALYHNGNDDNTAVGSFALYNNNGGIFNIALGALAGFNLTTGDNNIYIGNQGVDGESNTIRIGPLTTQTATYIAGISGTTVAGGVGVIIDSNGRLGTVTSSARYKDAIQPMDKASEAILLLQPVSFRYKHELDPQGIPQFGLVAEEVEKVNPDLVARDEQGKPYTVRYEAVNAMLLNEFLKAHGKIEEQACKVQEQDHKLAAQDTKAQEQDAAIARLESLVAHQQKQIGALSYQVQKVSNQLRTQAPASRVIAEN